MDNQRYGYTPRDINSRSGIYFEHTHKQNLTKQDNTHYTPAVHKTKFWKRDKKPKKKEASVVKSARQTVTQVANLPLVQVSYKAHILTTTTRTLLTQSFCHPGNAPIDEAAYIFPLYAGCSVVSFVCHVGPKKIITGVVQPKKIARATYGKAKSRGHTAGLLEEFTPEVFKTSLGNIPAGVTVRVEITYITELKHDTGVDGIRFTVPTSIAPRYGDPPEGLFGGEHETHSEKGVLFSIRITVGERISSIESPSHRVSVRLGTHKATTKTGRNLVNQHDDKKALVTLCQRSMHLRGDFVLLVTTVTPGFLCTPMALLEAHPTVPGQQALMVTLVPRFTGPKSTQKREIIFIVDRSGSMKPRIAPLKSAVSVFVKSLPVGCKFNICSFGSDYSFFWEKSQDYSADTVRAALKLVDRFNARMGGTELLKPIQETVKRRRKDMNTEVIVLTDGEIWGEDQVLGYIKQATGDSKGKLRFFSIGLGSEVSHSLVEGIARTGGGYSQIVADGSDEQDAGGWEGKVVKMLKAALTEHVDHYSLKVIHEGFRETDEEDSDEEEESTPPSSIAPGTANTGRTTTAPQAAKKLLLFDPNEDLGMAPGTPPSDDELPLRRPVAIANPSLSEDRFSHLKRLENPGVLQAPYQIPPLYSQVRTVVYLLISPSGDRLLRNPTSVKFQGTASGVEIEQSIPITRIGEPGLTIHQLAARMALRDLEDGSSWLHSGKYGTSPKDDKFREYVEREGEFLSIKWDLASKWASFVAVEDEFLDKEAAEKAIISANAKNSQREKGNSSSDADDGSDCYAPTDGGPGAGMFGTASIKTPVMGRLKDRHYGIMMSTGPSISYHYTSVNQGPQYLSQSSHTYGDYSGNSGGNNTLGHGNIHGDHSGSNKHRPEFSKEAIPPPRAPKSNRSRRGEATGGAKIRKARCAGETGREGRIFREPTPSGNKNARYWDQNSHIYGSYSDKSRSKNNGSINTGNNSYNATIRNGNFNCGSTNNSNANTWGDASGRFAAVEDEFLDKETTEEGVVGAGTENSQREKGNSSSDIDYGSDCYAITDGGSGAGMSGTASIETPVVDRLGHGHYGGVIHTGPSTSHHYPYYASQGPLNARQSPHTCDDGSGNSGDNNTLGHSNIHSDHGGNTERCLKFSKEAIPPSRAPKSNRSRRGEETGGARIRQARCTGETGRERRIFEEPTLSGGGDARYWNQNSHIYGSYSGKSESKNTFENRKISGSNNTGNNSYNTTIGNGNSNCDNTNNLNANTWNDTSGRFAAVEDGFLVRGATEKVTIKANARNLQREKGNSSIDVNDGSDCYALTDGGLGAGTLETNSIKTPATDRPNYGFGALSLGGQSSAPVVTLSLGKTPPPVALAREIPGASRVMHAGHDSMPILLQPRDEVTDGSWGRLAYSVPEPRRSMAVTDRSHRGEKRISGPFYSPGASENGGGINIRASSISHNYSNRSALPLMPASLSPSRLEGAVRKSDEIYTSPYPEILESRFQCRPQQRTEIPPMRYGMGAGGIESEEITPPEGVMRGRYYSPPRRSSGGRTPRTNPKPSKNDTSHQKVVWIIRLQELMGSFPATEEMAHLIGLELLDVEKLARELFPDKTTGKSKVLAMTSLVVAYLELEMHEQEDTWQMVVEKAHEFVEEGCERADILKEKAEEMIEEKAMKDGGEEDLRVGDYT